MCQKIRSEHPDGKFCQAPPADVVNAVGDKPKRPKKQKGKQGADPKATPKAKATPKKGAGAKGGGGKGGGGLPKKGTSDSAALVLCEGDSLRHLIDTVPALLDTEAKSVFEI